MWTINTRNQKIQQNVYISISTNLVRKFLKEMVVMSKIELYKLFSIVGRQYLSIWFP